MLAEHRSPLKWVEFTDWDRLYRFLLENPEISRFWCGDKRSELDQEELIKSLYPFLDMKGYEDGLHGHIKNIIIDREGNIEIKSDYPSKSFSAMKLAKNACTILLTEGQKIKNITILGLNDHLITKCTQEE